MNWYSKHSAILLKSHSSRLIFWSVYPLSKYRKWNYGAYYLQAKLSLKQYCTPEIACNFIFSTKIPSKNLTLKKNRQSIWRLRQKLCQFLFFRCDVIIDKLSKLEKISCVIPYYIEMKDSFYLGKFYVRLL